MTDTATLITQLRVLAHLTRTEAQVARLRVPQATGDDVQDELRRNAADADARAARIAGVLRDLGALPDPVTPVLGRVAALVRGALEQAQPLDEALIGDLALEHQLRDRARYVGALADAAGLPAVRALADDLVTAHDETVGWLHGVLADVAGGQRAALGASPLQSVAAQVTRAANAPRRAALDEVGAAVTGTVDSVRQAGEEAASTVVTAGRDALAATRDTAVQVAGTTVGAGRDVLGTARDTAAQALAAGQDTLTAGRDTVARAVGDVARRPAGTEDTTAAADAPGTGAPDTGAPGPEAPDTGTRSSEPADPPIPGFAALSAQAAVAALRTLDRAADLDAVLAFEQAHGNRPAVVAAARIRAGAVREG